MNPPPPARSRRVPLVLVAFLVVGLSVGLAATYLAAPPPGYALPTSELTTGGIGLQELGWILLSLLIVPFALLGVVRLRQGRGLASYRPIVTFLVAGMLALAFLVVARLVVNAPASSRLIGNNTTGGATPPGSTPTCTTNCTYVPGPAPVFPGVPGWVGYVGLIVVVGIALLALASLVNRPREPEAGPAVAVVRKSLEAALGALAPGSSADPRAVVIALYAQLLERVVPFLDAYETATPREIERESVRRFQIQPRNAQTLTRLFEEARYSTHPFSEARVDEARAALRAALNDLDVASHRQ